MEELSSNQNVESVIEKRKFRLISKAKHFLTDKNNAILLGIILFAFIIRLYFFIITKSQPLWWDEAVYGSLAKNIVSNMWAGTDLIQHESIIRPPLFIFEWAFLLLLKIPEAASRFILEIIPSTLSVIFVYLIGKEVFNKRVGLISAFIFSVLWVHLFHSMRFLTDVPSLLFLFASIYFFIKANKQELDYKFLSIAIFLLSISTLVRFLNGVIFFVYLILLLVSKNLNLNNKKFWKSVLIGVSPLIIFFIYNFITYQNIFPAFFGSDYVSPEETSALPFAWNLLNYVPVYLKTILFIFFMLGLAMVIFEILVGYNLMKKNLRIRNYFLLLLILVIIYSFFIFYMRIGDDRWLLIISLPLCCFAGLGIDGVYNLIKKYNKYFAITLVLAVLFFGAYVQITYANELIKNKQTSFLQIRQGFEWLNQNTPEDSVIIGNGIQPYTVYYAERQYRDFPANSSGQQIISEANYLVLHAFSPSSAYLEPYLQENQEKWKPLGVFFFDAKQTQPALVIYQKN